MIPRSKYFPWLIGVAALYVVSLLADMAINDYLTQHGSVVREQSYGKVFPVTVNYGKIVFVTNTERQILPVLDSLPFALLTLTVLLFGLNQRKPNIRHDRPNDAERRDK